MNDSTIACTDDSRWTISIPCFMAGLRAKIEQARQSMDQLTAAVNRVEHLARKQGLLPIANDAWVSEVWLGPGLTVNDLEQFVKSMPPHNPDNALI